MAKFKVATPAGLSFTTAVAGDYCYEMEDLAYLGAVIIEGPNAEDGFIAFAQGADAAYA